MGLVNHIITEYLGQKEETSILVSVAKLLRLSIRVPFFKSL